ncbi:hypothetical protein [Kingella potus]|uniref:hypothetical protein n=1 Tax=Kingella potus TaxID=265175 RepID=UPI001FD3320E|nr:hypothetical protein [Kingella potus]UOP00108.1 hypothetical protein LVJ84_09045 [Kingella potus]
MPHTAPRPRLRFQTAYRFPPMPHRPDVRIRKPSANCRPNASAPAPPASAPKRKQEGNRAQTAPARRECFPACKRHVQTRTQAAPQRRQAGKQAVFPAAQTAAAQTLPPARHCRQEALRPTRLHRPHTLQRRHPLPQIVHLAPQRGQLLSASARPFFPRYMVYGQPQHRARQQAGYRFAVHRAKQRGSKKQDVFHIALTKEASAADCSAETPHGKKGRLKNKYFQTALIPSPACGGGLGWGLLPLRLRWRAGKRFGKPPPLSPTLPAQAQEREQVCGGFFGFNFVEAALSDGLFCFICRPRVGCVAPRRRTRICRLFGKAVCKTKNACVASHTPYRTA